MKFWQPGLVSFDQISGTPGQPGARSRLKYKMNGREVEMIETITVRNLPDEFSGAYEAKGVTTSIRNKFIQVSDNKTLWEAENDFQFKGMMKFFAALMPGAFKKQTQKYLDNFKKIAESNAAG